MSIAVDFADLYLQYHDKIYAYIYRRTSNEAVAEDLAAETFVKAMDAMLRDAGARRSVSGWLHRIAHNLVIDHYRARDRFCCVSLDAIATLPDDLQPDQVFEQNYLRERVECAIGRLSDSQREVLFLRLDGWRNQEIAARTGNNVGAVKAIWYRSLNALHGYLGEFTEGRPRPSRVTIEETVALIAATLQSRGPMTLTELAQATRLKRTTVRSALICNPREFVMAGQTTTPRGHGIATVWGLVT